MTVPAGVDLPSLIDIRRQLHRLAELSGQEVETARTVREFLKPLQPQQIINGLGGNGLAAVFQGGEPGPVVVLRAELDAIAVDETGDHPWSSAQPGVAHKCGHDGHMTILMGVAQSLAHSPLDCGRVILLFQPAEETGQGAAAVCADPRILEWEPDWLFALHNLPGYPLNQLIIREGAFCAGSAGCTLELKGRTAHAAYPDQGLSPGPAMSELVTALVTLPLPLEKEGRLALVTVTHARLGDPSFGISPGQAEIQATLRADDPLVLQRLKDEAAKLAASLASRHGLDHTVEFAEEFPPTINDAAAVRLVEAAAQDLDLVITPAEESPFRWSEDFGQLLNLGKGALFGMGSGVDHPPLHSGSFDFPEPILETGVSLFDRLCRNLLSAN